MTVTLGISRNPTRKVEIGERKDDEQFKYQLKKEKNKCCEHLAWWNQLQHWKQIVQLDVLIHTSNIHFLPHHTMNEILDIQKDLQAYLSDRDEKLQK